MDKLEFNRENSLEIRKVMIGFRDESFDQWPDAIPFTVAMTGLVGWMHDAIEKLFPEENDGEG